MRSPTKRTITNTYNNRLRTTPGKMVTTSKKDVSQMGMDKDNYVGYKPKEKVHILPHLQDIYAKLDFNNNLQPYPAEELIQNKNRVDKLITRMMEKPHEGRCMIHEKQVLNLYCQKEKELLCIICAHGDNTHKDKTHNIVPIERIQPHLLMQIQRVKERIKIIIEKLEDWERKLDDKIQQLSDAYKNISNTTDQLFNILIQEIQTTKKVFSKNLLKNQTRASKIMKTYHDEIQKAKNMYSKYLIQSKHFSLPDQLGLLKILNGQMGVAQKLIKKAHETINIIPAWKEVNNALEKLKERNDIETKALQERQILITQF